MVKEAMELRIDESIWYMLVILQQRAYDSWEFVSALPDHGEDKTTYVVDFYKEYRKEYK